MTRFIPIAASTDAVAWLLKEQRESLTVVSKHGLGDNVFFSPCFEPLGGYCGKLFVCSAVNAYATIFHDSPLVTPVYAGGVNGTGLRLTTAAEFAAHFDRLGLDLGVAESFVYHFGSFEPPLPYSDPTAFVKGRRNIVEMGLSAPPATEVPRYHVAPDAASKPMVDAVLDRWFPGRELIAVARYGHTDVGKNFGHDNRNTLETVDLVERAFPGRYKFLSLDYIPGDHAADGHRPNVRSVYGFLPCDAASMHHALSRAVLLVTVPTGPMIVGATVPTLRMLTLWGEMKPWHLLDPQHGDRVWALVRNPSDASEDFMRGWSDEEAAAVRGRWKMIGSEITPETVAGCAIRMLKGE